MMNLSRYCLPFFLTTLLFAAPGYLMAKQDLEQMDIETLMQLEVVVSSPAKRQQPLADVASAIFVIDEEDIKSSGATSVPELLRMVPGLHVARINTQTWAVSARGFNDRFANKLLVLVDGRTIYSPLFSGVEWDERDVMLEDLERIEVIRGPGGTLWGSNAVNGVINITTKQAKDTQGGLLTAAAGNQEQVFGSGRYGGQLGDDAFYRLYIKGFSRDALEDGNGFNPSDDWEQTQGGGRLDWQSGNDKLTLQSDFYAGKSTKSFTIRTNNPTPGLIFGNNGLQTFSAFADTQKFSGDINGGNVTARWQRTLSEDSALRFQFYYDHASRNFHNYLRQERDSYDIDFQHYFSPLPKHLLTWGGGYRRIDDDIKGRPGEVEYNPGQRTVEIWNAFIQEEYTLIDEVLTLTVGSRFEHHDFTGLEIQPSARFLWKPIANHSFWGAVSRTTRTPSRFERDGTLDVLLANTGSPPFSTSFIGNNDYDSEELIAFELGYRTKLLNQVSIDITGFYNSYDKLRSFRAGTAIVETNPPPAHAIIPLLIVNEAQAHSYGVELAADWQVTDFWKLNLGYTYFDIDFDTPNNITLLDSLEANPPNHLLSLRSLLNIRPNLDLNLWFRYSDALGPSDNIASFVTLDANLAWQATKNLELSLVGQNLLEDTRPEGQLQFNNSPPPVELERSFYIKFLMSF